jgi:KUP system potassium uptake protein
MLLMIFWTWAKSLEDAFDATNRRDLRDFIGHRDCSPFSEEKNALDRESSEIRLSLTRGLGGAQAAGTFKRPAISRADSVATMVNGRDADSETFYYMAPREKEAEEEQKRELVRTDTCAIFHNTSAARGVPHSFVGESILDALVVRQS